MTGRDDSKLRSLICPNCRQTLPVHQVQDFEQQQLIYMRCDMCDADITQQQIDNTSGIR